MTPGALFMLLVIVLALVVLYVILRLKLRALELRSHDKRR